jgi:hypothetical protein
MRIESIPRVITFLPALTVAVWLTAGNSVLAQGYSLDWWSVDGGGGTSAGGSFILSGTVGQPDAGIMTGGQYTLSGGFWGVIAGLPSPGAPDLIVTRSNATVVVSWQLPAEGWLLHYTTALTTGPGVWTEIPPPYKTNGSYLQFTEPLPAGNRFYRLHKTQP